MAHILSSNAKIQADWNARVNDEVNKAIFESDISFMEGVHTYTLQEALNNILDVSQSIILKNESLTPEELSKQSQEAQDSIIQGMLNIMAAKMTVQNIISFLDDELANAATGLKFSGTVGDGTFGDFVETDIFGIGLGRDIYNNPIVNEGLRNRPTGDLVLRELNPDYQALSELLGDIELKTKRWGSKSGDQPVGNITLMGIPEELKGNAFLKDIAILIKLQMKMKNWMYFMVEQRSDGSPEFHYKRILLFTQLMIEKVQAYLNQHTTIKADPSGGFVKDRTGITYKQTYSVMIAVGKKGVRLEEVGEMYHQPAFDFLNWIRSDRGRQSAFYANVRARASK